MPSMNYKEYIKTEKLPVFWCAGCGDGIVLQILARSFSELELEPNEITVVTGIGCWGKADDYIRTNSFHGTHGRALGFATGIKLGNPKLKVLALMGDGDGVTIGGNHFIHAARRNVDVTAIIVNNFNYGMTGGQYSGTTPEHAFTSTSPCGHLEEQFDICSLAMAAGAPYVARGTVMNPMATKHLVKQAISKTGFSVVEILSTCPSQFGRRNGMESSYELMEWIQNQCVSVEQVKEMNEDAIKNKFVVGRLCDRDKTDYSTKYTQLADSLSLRGAGDE